MAEEGFKRKLAAILSADVEGYGRLMDDDEEATVRTLTAYRNAITSLENAEEAVEAALPETIPPPEPEQPTGESPAPDNAESPSEEASDDTTSPGPEV